MAFLLHRRPLSRRTFLRGLGATIALPFLDAMTPRHSHAQNAVNAHFVGIYTPNGYNMDRIRPVGEGSSYVLPPTLEPLAPWRDELLLVTGLHNRGGDAQGDGPGDHARGTASFLTASHPYKTDGSDIRVGTSIDQHIARVLGRNTRFASLELACEGGQSAGACDSGYSCVYSRHIAWASPTTPLPGETNPRALFDRLFPESGHNNAEDVARRRSFNASILDGTADDIARLSQVLGTKDKQKLDEYLTGVRDLERRINGDFEDGNSSSLFVCQSQVRPANTVTAGEDPTLYIQTMLDLLTVALACGQTNVATIMLGTSGSGRSYPFLGVRSGHHEISHHQSDAQKLTDIATIDRWYMSHYAYLLQKMSSVEMSEGVSLLDQTILLAGSEIADGNSHAHNNQIHIVAGGAQLGLPRGKHLRFADGEPVADFYMAIAAQLGVNLSSMGDDGSSPLPLDG